VWAHVLERDPLHWYGSVGVDAGADRGVSLNDPVLGRKGDAVVAVGRVIEVRPQTSTVLLLTDQRSAAAAYLSSGTLEGLIQGQDGPHLRMNYLNSEAAIDHDDLVYTSPTSATFPPDVLIGRVARVYPRDPFLAFQSVEVAPALDAASLQEVLILRASTLPGEGPLPAPPPPSEFSASPASPASAAPAPPVPAAAAAPAVSTSAAAGAAPRRRRRPAAVAVSTAAAKSARAPEAAAAADVPSDEEPQ
jgi:rod shape-determining protein MreC